MKIKDGMETELVLLKHASVEREILFSEVNALLQAKGIVEPTYLKALLAREENHPTAMQLEKMGVAIPHVDVEHVSQEKLVIVTCPEGIEFKQAEDPDLTIKVNIIFFLLLKEKDAHIEFLMKLIGLFRQTEKMDFILSSNSTSEVIEMLTLELNQ
jgi:mannitol/fructose-specific phosphotransferase system IIA component (Ntr-type)